MKRIYISVLIVLVISIVLLYLGCSNGEEVPVDDPAEETAVDPVDDPEEDPAEEPADDPAEDPAEDLTLEEEKEQYLQEELEERGITDLDRELTDHVMAEEVVKYGYIRDEDAKEVIELAYNEDRDGFFQGNVQGYMEEELEGALISVDFEDGAVPAEELGIEVVTLVPGAFNVLIPMANAEQEFEVNKESVLLLDADPVVSARLVFFEGTSEADIERISNEIEQLMEEKYPGRSINLTVIVED